MDRRLCIFDNFAIYSGHLNQNRIHSHHALQLTVPLKGSLEVQVETEKIQCRAILLNQQVEHRILPIESEMVVILFEPVRNCEYKIGFGSDKYQIIENPDDIINHVNAERYSEIIDAIAAGRDTILLDQRIQGILSHIDREENCGHSLDYFMNSAGLSKSRISHLFKSEVGVTLKSFVLWKKCQFAIDSMRSSDNLSEIALDCGFSDLSHLSRTFRKMFGCKISDLFKNSVSVQVDFLE